MAAQVGSLRVTVGADITGLRTGMRNAQRQVAQSSKAMQKSVGDLQLSLKEVATFSSRIFRAGALVFGGAFGAQALLSITDAAKSLTAQLKLATAEYGSFEKAQKDVRNIAEATRSDLLATSELYAALQRNSGQLGTTQEQVARATQTVAEAFKISGAATSEQSAATRQLIQAFQSGVLRGDEFNSVMENAPRLSRLLADSLGVTVGKLRAMAEAGELTSDKLVRAFTDKKFTAGLDEEFKQLPVTFDQAMGQVYNAAVIVFSAFDRGGQFSNSIATFVSDGTEGFTQLEQKAYHFGESVADVFSALQEIRTALASIKTEGIGSLVGLTDASYGLRDALADVLGVADGVANAFANLINAPGNLIRLTTGIGGPVITNPFDMRGGFIKATNQRRLDATRQQIFGRSAQDMLAEFGLGRKPPPFVPPPAKAKGGRTAKAPRDRSADVQFQFDQEIRRAQMQVLQAQQDLAGSAEQRAKIALQILDLEKATQDAELAERVRKAERDFAEKKITAGALAQVKVQAQQLQAENDKLDAVKRQAFTEEQLARKTQAEFDLADQHREFSLEALRAQDQLATTQAEHRRIQLQILDAEIEQKRLELEHQKDLAIRNGATKEEIAVIQDKIDHLSTERAQGAASIAASTRGPMEDYLASLPTTVDKAQEALEQLQVQGFEGLIDAALELSNGLDSAAKSLLQTLRNFLLGMARMELQKGLGSILQGGVGQGGILGSLFGGIFGSGSIGDVGASMDVSFGSAVPLSSVPVDFGFASGGSFTILGNKGIDQNVMSINGIPVGNVSYGERVNISNDNERGKRMGRGDVTMYVNTPDADSFRRSEGQITRGLRRKLA